MNIRKYLREYLYNLKEKVKKYDKNAQNPFYEPGNNPFSENFPQTYVWIEADDDQTTE